MDETCKTVAPPGYVGSNLEWTWKQRQFDARKARLEKWQAKMQNGPVKLAGSGTSNKTQPHLKVEDRFATIWSEATTLLVHLCETHDKLGGLHAAGLSIDEIRYTARTGQVAWGLTLIGQIIYPGLSTILDKIVLEYINALEKICAVFTRLGIAGFAISVSFCKRTTSQIKLEGHAAVQQQGLAAKLHYAAGVEVNKDSDIQLFHEQVLPAWGGWRLESMLQQRIIERTTRGGGFGDTEILCNFTAIAYVTRSSFLVFFNSSTQTGLPTYNDARVAVMSIHRINKIAETPPNSHPLVLDRLTSYSLVATKATLGGTQTRLRGALVPANCDLRQDLATCIDNLGPESGMRYLHAKTTLRHDTVVPMDEAITNADVVQRHAISRIVEMMPRTAATTQYLQRAVAHTSAAAAGHMPASERVSVPQEPADAGVGAVGRSNQDARDATNAMLSCLVGCAPKHIFDNDHVQQLCADRIGRMVDRRVPTAHGNKLRVSFTWQVDGTKHAQHGPGGDTADLARQNFWTLCKRVHSEITRGGSPSEKIARHRYFRHVMDEILSALAR